MNVLQDVANLSKGVIMHHWDTDGIVSAAILRNYFKVKQPRVKLDVFMPTITNYYLTDNQFEYLQQQGYEFIVTCDLNLPPDIVQRLAKMWPGQVYFFDHHHHPAPHPNVHYYNKVHPACASHIAEVLELPYDLLPVLAMVGDREESIQTDKTYYPYVQAVMADHNLTFSQLLLARRLIDSNYIMDDYQGIQETITLLQDDPLAIFSDVRLEQNLHTIDAAIEQLIAQEPQKISDRVWFWEIKTPLAILSHVTRSLSRQYPDKIIFTRQHKTGQYTCYIRKRTAKFDARDIIAFAHTLGLNSGGKEEVAGIIIPETSMATIFPKLQDKLLELNP
ncbi:MAG: phosphoesterase RecJ protein [uncultured bacterium]|nr:MAG: phosphoesterase RecJ protein [uncultured bacterium]